MFVRKKCIAGAGMLPIVGVLGVLAGCDRFQSPGAVCSSQDTYDSLNKIIASSAPKGGLGELLGVPTPQGSSKAGMAEKLGQYLKYTLSTVSSVDKDTGKVSCGSLLTFSGSKDAVHAAQGADDSGELALAMLTERQASPDAFVPPVPINERTADHISFQITFSVQKTADQSDSVVVLDNASILGKIAAAGIVAAEKPAQPAPAEAPPEPTGLGTPDNADDPAADTNASEPAAASASNDSFHGVTVGMAYSDARQQLINSGFKPVYREHDTDCDNSKACTHPETESCAADRPICLYKFTDGSQIWQVITEGDVDDPPVTSISKVAN